MNAINAYNRLNANVAGLKKASEKLASGYRINRAGDDAAGLAVSEKMRSQIKGLNQAIRNSQDGINMIQTFEGAAQETHSILQRMKELATESANGTYDNATDRAAMELEFKQLNDELDQIADTDFNGTIVLNGGQMSDGMYALTEDKSDFITSDTGEYINGAEFDYKTGKELLEAENASADTREAADVTDTSVYEVGDEFGNQNTGHAAGSIIDNNTYTSEAANKLWDATGVDKAITSMNVTFVKDGDSWKAIGAYDDDGVIEDFDGSALTGTALETGGFDVTWDGGDIKAIFDSKGSVDGDYLTVNFTNVADESYAPDHIGFDEGAKDSSENIVSGVEIALGKDVTTANMNDDIKAALDEIDANDIVFEKNADGSFKLVDGDKFAAVKFYDNAGTEITDFDNITLADDDVITIKSAADKEVATLTLTPSEWGSDPTVTIGATSDGAGGSINNGASATLTYKDGTGWTTDGTTLADLSAVAVGGGSVSVTIAEGAADGDKITITNAGAQITAGGSTAGMTATYTPKTAPSTTIGIHVDGYHLAGDAVVTANSIATDADMLAKMQEAAGGTKGDKPLSVSDAFENSTARLTYANNITLQTGARSKDAVRFTFAYNQDGNVDMGGLTANLNLSSRGDGLNTANLSLANQKSANEAIDQIDKAINKTSMVRATFGAIQNRLEHKITNLTTTSENLTEAESAIRDTDMASEMMNYTKFNILQQAAQSMLAQANQQPQSILQLLG